MPFWPTTDGYDVGEWLGQTRCHSTADDEIYHVRVLVVLFVDIWVVLEGRVPKGDD